MSQTHPSDRAKNATYIDLWKAHDRWKAGQTARSYFGYLSCGTQIEESFKNTFKLHLYVAPVILDRPAVDENRETQIFVGNHATSTTLRGRSVRAVVRRSFPSQERFPPTSVGSGYVLHLKDERALSRSRWNERRLAQLLHYETKNCEGTKISPM